MGRAPAALVLAAAVLAGCGGGSDRAATTPAAGSQTTPTAPPSQSLPGKRHAADARSIRIITNWAESLRQGHVRRAAHYFAVPAVVVGRVGDPPIRLTTPGQVLSFNTGFPCGAVLARAVGVGRYTVATFRLVERTGPRPGICGSGAGQSARTAFLIRAGRIAVWRRLPDQPGAPQGPSI